MNETYEFEGIIGKTSESIKVINLIKKVASIDTPVLIQGESGTGKELVARAIHNQSKRKDKQFLPINCGAFPESLQESELFGHEKGSFTGAVSMRRGAFEIATGGTLFLDELGDTTLSTQVSLLRVLQDGELRRVGGSEIIKTDVRLISATNQNLKQKMEEGTFREDLFYRLNVIIINIPPLRDRMEEIPLLVERFIDLFSRKNSKTVKGVSPQVLERFYRYIWPGNIRELKNIIERAVIMSSKNIIQQKDLPPNFNESIARFPRHTRQTDVTFREAREELERIYFTDLLRRVNGNISKAAEKSGVDRKTVRKIANKYKINFEF